MRFALILSLLAGLAPAQTPLAALYQKVLNPQVDAGRVAVVENLNFHRDRLQFQLLSGRLALAQRAGGHVTAAVFQGQGRLVVEPPNPIEAQQMRLFLGHAEIALEFNEAIFRFPRSADLLSRLGKQAFFKPASDVAGFQQAFDRSAKRIEAEGLPEAARILGGLGAAQPEASTPWLADLKTRGHSWIEAEFDPLDKEPVSVTQIIQRAETGITAFADTWTQFQDRAERQANTALEDEHVAPAHLGNYDIRLRVPGNLDLQAQAEMTVTARTATGPGLFLNLDPNLRLTAATTEAGQPVGWIQPKNPQRIPPARYFGNWLYLQLPAPLAAGQSMRLRLAYHGKYVITRVGDGNFFARSMGWYPFEPFGAAIHHARFDLHFNVKKDYSVIATGKLVSLKKVKDRRISEWQSEPPSTVAGFAMGRYKGFGAKIKMPAGPRLTVEAFANTSPDDSFRAIENLGNMPYVNGNGQTQFGYNNLPPGLANLSPVRLAPKALASVADAVHFFSFFFGPYPYSKLDLVNIPGDYGQGWPSLLYLSSLSFLDSTQLHELGVGEAGLRQLSDTFRAHEVSHQWWGHVVGWNTAHDQWLSEGFANGSAVLYEQIRVKPSAAVATLKEWRRDLFQKDIFGHVPNQLGALWLGERLGSSVDPQGYNVVVYDKGGYIFTMLRDMLINPRLKNPYQPFIDMMHAFTRAYAGKTASTADFENIANRYMTPIMDIDGNHRLDWFFNEYVYHRKVPTVEFHWSETPRPGGGIVLNLQIQNSEGWKGLLPLTLHEGHHHNLAVTVRVVRPAAEYHIPLPMQLKKVVANEYEQMLVHVKQ